MINPIFYVALGDSTGVGVGAVNGGYVTRLYKRMLEQRPVFPAREPLRQRRDHRRCAARPVEQRHCEESATGHNSASASTTSATRSPRTVRAKLRSHSECAQGENQGPRSSFKHSRRFHRTRRARILTRQVSRQIVTFNQRLEAIANRHGATIFDIFSITTRELPSHPEYFSPDGFHPSDQGYEMCAVQMWPVIERVLQTI
jgi:hypothetical protein